MIYDLTPEERILIWQKIQLLYGKYLSGVSVPPDVTTYQLKIDTKEVLTK